MARTLAQEQYFTPTPIQAKAIPHVLAGRDLVGVAQTGTGKTAAFALPILQRLEQRRTRVVPRHCRVLVLSPTRELSSQILESFRTYGGHLRPTTALAIGGVPIHRQVKAVANGVEILVATPGRLLDLIRSRAVVLDDVEVFVLDEADRMLDMGFIHDIRAIAAKLPARRQTLLFSATMPNEIENLAASLLHEPLRVAATPSATTADRVSQRVIHVPRSAKSALLAEVLKSERAERALVFTRTKRGADRVVRALAGAGLPAQAIHGNKSQNQRMRVLAAFRNGSVRTLVATDIAARGIDVDGVTHVINFELPNIPDSYVHRIGRTARAGAAGIAISFCDAEERTYLRDIEKLIGATIAATAHRNHPVPAQSSRAAPTSPHPVQQKKKRRRGRNRRHNDADANGRGQAAAHAPRNDGLEGIRFLHRPLDRTREIGRAHV